MNIERIREIQQETAYPDSVSVQQALLKVWNECEQGKAVKNNGGNVVLPQTEQCNIHDVVARFKVNAYLHGKEVWVFTDSLKVAEKVQQDAECNAICSIIYELTDDGWI